MGTWGLGGTQELVVAWAEGWEISSLRSTDLPSLAIRLLPNLSLPGKALCCSLDPKNHCVRGSS